MKGFARILFLLALGVPVAWGQRGDAKDKPEHVQRPPSFPIPPSPALPPEAALQTLRVAPGFRVELVACEPLVEDPVALAFDPDGRIWVVEMRGWMNDVDGAGQDQPVGRIVKLEDSDGDGRMDRSTVFLDGLIMPRAIQLARDGVLVGAPPYLWFYRDTDGDGRADEKTELAADYMNSPAPYNAELDSNGLLWNIDNWLYSASYSARFRYRDGRWERQPAVVAGQWGLSQDDYGRHFFNTNQDQLRASPLPSHYGSRNPHLYRPAAWNARVATDQTVWPIRVSPGANRGYRPGVLRPDGKLRIFESACGPAIYRGGLFPDEFDGNAFVADPVGHLVKRNIVSERQGILSAEQAYAGHEFLASTDERFRPVNVYTGPEGALYVVDMYRGVIESSIYMTTYLRRQIAERGLDRPLGLGRIYRIVPTAAGGAETVKMSALKGAQLVDYLSDRNGWRRETAQRLLVERADSSVKPLLRRLALTAPRAVTRLHALWTLEGLDSLDESVILTALEDPSEKVRGAAIRLSEPWLRETLDSAVSRRVLGAMNDPAAEVLLQVGLSLGEVESPNRETALAQFVAKFGAHIAVNAHPYLANVVVSGLHGCELEFLERILTSSGVKIQAAGMEELLGTLSSAIFREGKLPRIERLFARIGEGHGEPSWIRRALISGIASVPRKQLPARPNAIGNWERIVDPAVNAAAARLAGSMTWPGKPGDVDAPALTAAQRQRFDAGKREYLVCAACHLPTGQGINGLAPALVDSPRALGPPEVLARIVLHGKHEHSAYPPMPSFSYLDDERIASILTYIRREWNHRASAIEPDVVSRMRSEKRNREGPMTKEELETSSSP